MEEKAETNPVLELLFKLCAEAGNTYVPVKRKTMALDDKNLDTAAGVRFVRDRLNELIDK